MLALYLIVGIWRLEDLPFIITAPQNCGRTKGGPKVGYWSTVMPRKDESRWQNLMATKLIGFTFPGASDCW